MKILILANNDLGLYKFRKELISELLSPGSFLNGVENGKNEVYISLPDGDSVPFLEKLGCKFINTPVDRRTVNPFEDLKLLRRYIKIIKESKPNLILTYTIKPNIYGSLAAAVCKIPVAANITGLGTAFQKDGLIKKIVIFLYKTAFRKVRTVFFENSENLQTFLSYKIIPPNNAVKLNGAGVNLEEYSFCDYPSAEKDIRFLFIGRIMKEKGIDELFETAKRVKSKYPHVQFDIVGPFEDSYQQKVQTLASCGIVNYFGFQSDVKPFIKNCHCFVLPSYHEGMANTLLESAATGRPLITSAIHGCMEAVENGENGFLCEVKNADDLTDKIIDFIELPYAKKIEMGKASRRLAEERFDKKSVVSETLKHLKNMNELMY